MIDVALLKAGESTRIDGGYMAYLTKGSAVAGDVVVSDGDLIRGDGLELRAIEDAEVLVIKESESIS